jgi:hypothetical protein
MIVKVLGVLLIAVSGYLGWWSISHAAWLWLVPSVFAFLGAIGLFLHKRWGSYIWHAIALIVSVWWLQSIVRFLFSGWPEASWLNIGISLTPGLFLLVVCVGGSIVVVKHFRSAADAL